MGGTDFDIVMRLKPEMQAGAEAARAQFMQMTASMNENAKGTEAALQRLTKSLSGAALINDAKNIALAVDKIGGAAFLTSQQVEKFGAIAQQAVEKARAIGVELPPGVQALADKFSLAAEHGSHLQTAMSGLIPAGGNLASAFGSLKGTLTEAFEHPAQAAGHLAHTLAADLSGSLGAVGIAAGAAVGALFAVGVAAFELAEKSAAVGANLQDMHEKTGIAVPALSRLSNAARVAGTDINQLSNLVFMMQKNMEETPDKFTEGLTRLNLNVAEFKRLTPDQQLIAFATALKATEDPVQRNAAGYEVMGRQFRDGAASLAKLNEALERTADITPWTEEQAKHAEEFEMTLTSLKVHAEDLADSLGRDVIEAIEGVKTELDHPFKFGVGTLGAFLQYGFVGGMGNAVASALTADVMAPYLKKNENDIALQKDTNGIVPGASTEETSRLIDGWTKERQAAAAKEMEFWREYNSIGANVLDTINQIDGATVEGIKADLQRGVSVEMIAKAFGVYKEQVQAVEKEEKFLEAVTSATNKAFTDRIAVIPNLSDRTRQFRFELEGLTAEGLIPNAAAFDDLGRAELANKVYADQWTTSEKALATQLAHTIGLMPDLGNQAKANMDRAVVETHHVQDAVHDLGAAFQNLGRDIDGPMGRAISDMGKYIEKLADAETGAEQLAAAVQAGTALAGGFTTAGSRGSNIAKYAGEGASIGSYFGPYGTVVGGGIGAVVGAFKVPDDEKAARDQFNAFKASMDQMFNTTASGQQRVEAGGDAWNKMIIQVREAYLATGRTAADAMHDLESATLHTRQDVEKLPDDLARLNAAIQDAAQDQSDLNAAMTKYKFTVEEMGPAFQRQELTKQALELENNFRLLVGAGADAHLVIDRMGEDINNFLHTALKTGTEVPEEMRPMLEQMAEMGKLTDENGNSITDLGASGIHWSETMTQGFDRVVTALEKVLSALGWVDDAVTKLPTDHPIHIPIIPVWQELQPQDIPGGYPTLPPGVETSFATEAYVRRPTLAMVGDVPGGEFVLRPSTVSAWMNASYGAGAALASQATSSGWWNPPRRTLEDAAPASTASGKTTTVYIGGPTVHLTSDDLKDPDRVIGIYKDALIDDRGGLRTMHEQIARKVFH